MSTIVRSNAPPYFRLRFDPLGATDVAIEIPCDAAGRVDLDALDEATRNAYFYGRLLRRLHLLDRMPVAEST